jgi:hypothetical protein
VCKQETGANNSRIRGAASSRSAQSLSTGSMHLGMNVKRTDVATKIPAPTVSSPVLGSNLFNAEADTALKSTIKLYMPVALYGAVSLKYCSHPS